MVDKFRLVAYGEAVTYLMVLAGAVVLHGFGGPDFVKITGPVHGVIFLVYTVMVLNIRERQGRRFWRTVLVIIASAVPLGGFFVGRDLHDATP